MKIKIHNSMSWYIITVSDGIVIESSIRPNGRDHWVVGTTLEWLKKYYHTPITCKEDATDYKFTEIE